VAIPYLVTPDLLKRGIEHVCYEYANLVSAAHWDLHGQAPWRTHCDDAFLLGYRKMRDFLMRDKRSERRGVEFPDILARDYLPSGFARTWDLPTWEKEWGAEMDKQLAHITFERDKEWDHMRWVPTLESEIRTAWSAFLNAVNDPTHKTDFASQLAICQAKPGFNSVTL
jgi:hypothetical protein